MGLPGCGSQVVDPSLGRGSVRHRDCDYSVVMKQHIKPLPLFAVSAASMFAFSSCDVDKTQDGELPDVEVEVEGEAKLPEYDVEGPEVKTDTKKVEVEVPTIDVDIPEEEDNE